ncbi:MAG TPA: gamma-glutamyltransferase, partial [Candidatus Ozemobacteraceae bacterium]|nr:gamma-glutamyltransferase [Candidatus Ozemobacteraceae bacterium]
LLKLSEAGTSPFASGPLAAQLTDDLKRRGSRYTLNDIISFNVRISSPIAVSIGSFTLIGPPPPCSSVAVMAALRAVFDHERRLGQRLSLDNRLIILDRLFSRITSSLAQSIRVPRRFLSDAAGPLSRPFGTTEEMPFTEQADEPPGETTHLVTWDRNGMIVSMTLTLGTHFGTGDYSPLGFFYNNELANIRHRYFTYPKDYPQDAGPVSTKSPFIILNGSRPILAIGGAGAGRIVSNLFLIIDSVLHHEKSLPEAVQAPRFHVQGKRVLLVEWSPQKPPLSSRGPWHRPGTKPAGADYFGLVSAVGAASGTLTAVGDYRRDGAAGALDIAPH